MKLYKKNSDGIAVSGAEQDWTTGMNNIGVKHRGFPALVSSANVDTNTHV